MYLGNVSRLGQQSRAHTAQIRCHEENSVSILAFSPKYGFTLVLSMDIMRVVYAVLVSGKDVASVEVEYVDEPPRLSPVEDMVARGPHLDVSNCLFF